MKGSVAFIRHAIAEGTLEGLARQIGDRASLLPGEPTESCVHRLAEEELRADHVVYIHRTGLRFNP